MEKLNILVLFGGQSSEHEVSCVSASNVIGLFDKNKYNITTVGITKEGRWLLWEGDTSSIKNGEWLLTAEKSAILSPDSSQGLVIINEGSTEYRKIDVVFPVLHGAYGEDGTIQGLCALARIPVVGPGMLSSAICMDKDVTKTVLKNFNIPQADWVCAYSYEDISIAADKVEEKFSYPVFVKPANAGSSVGIGKAKSRESLLKCLSEAFRHDRKVIIEEFIDCREIECAVLGNTDILASVPGEIIPSNEFYDYQAKYESDSRLIIPAILSEQDCEKVKALAKRIFSALGGRGMSRVDFFVHKTTGEIYFNEINTIPGFTGISMYPMLMRESGVDGTSLADRLVELAIEEFAGI